MASDHYLQLDGIWGDVKEAGHIGWIETFQFTPYYDDPKSRVIDNISFVCLWGRQTKRMFDLVVSGESVREGVLETFVETNGKRRLALRLRMIDITVAGYQHGLPTTSGSPVDVYTLEFAKAVFESGAISPVSVRGRLAR
jgi:type VI protein secretion system component Hcp